MRALTAPWPELSRLARGLRVAFVFALTALLSSLTDSWLDVGGVLIAQTTLLTSDVITKEAMRILVNNLVFAKSINRTYDSKFKMTGAASANGDTVRVRKPPRYLGRSGMAMSPEPLTETFVNVTLQYEWGVDLEVSDWDLALSLDNFSDKCLKPAAARIATYVDQQCMQRAAESIPYAVGTPGTIPTALLTYGLAGSKLDDNAAPQDDQRTMTISSRMQTYIVDAAKGLFQASEEIAKQYRKGHMGHWGGFRWQMDQNVFTHTVGALGGTPLVNGAGQSGASLITDGWTAAVATRLLQGDRFTIADVNHVNPANYMSTGEVQQFLVTADAASDVNGNLTIPISPSIVVSGSGQTVNALPANNAALTILGAANTQTPSGIASHRDVIALVFADLVVPKGKDMAGRMSDEQLGLSIRFIRDFETRTGQWLTRMDVIFGVADLRGESLGCVIYS